MPTVVVKRTGSGRSAWLQRRRERKWLLAVTGVLAFGLLLLYLEKAEDFGAVRAGLEQFEVVNLNAVAQENQSVLTGVFEDIYSDPADRQFLAEHLFSGIEEQQEAGFGGIPNVGTLNRLVTAQDIEEGGGTAFQERLEASRRRLGLTPTVLAQETSDEPPSYPAEQPEQPGLRVAGAVAGPDGAPMPGTLVTLQGGDRADTLRTDAGGRFAFTGLGTDTTYAVRPVKPYFAFDTQMLRDMEGDRTVQFTARAHQLPLFPSFEAFQSIKPRFVVRSPRGFLLRFLVLSLVFFGVFWGLHLFWQRTQFTGDSLLLPLVMMLTGMSLLLMFSLPDALRDRFLALDVVLGVFIGALLLAWISRLDVQRIGYQYAYGERKSFMWLGAAALLSAVLLLFGTGPTGSEGAKVNLSLGFVSVQPVEVIKACLLLFFAGYFARNWEYLRELEERNLPRWMQKLPFTVPRLRFAVPVLAGVLVAILFFILQRDLGPALVICTTFLLLYGTVRQRWLIATLGMAGLVGAFWLCYAYDLVPTVASRINMMLSPWDNEAGGGEHLAQVFWALTTGGTFGQGLGEGATYAVPAAHTDMVMAVVGEELGLIGFLGVLALYAVLFHRGLMIALEAGTAFSFFLGAGIVISSVLQLVLIVGGMLGVVPLSGVVSPLLSYGKSALIMHFVFIGVLLALSARGATVEERTVQQQRFGKTVKALGLGIFGLMALLGVRDAYVQVVKADDWIVKPALVEQAAGRRGYAYNPRILLALDRIRLGTLYDRNGIPLATSDPDVLTDTLATFGVDVEQVRRSGQERLYPFGALTFYLLGDANPTRTGWNNPRALYAERRFLSQLRGYDNRPDRDKGVDYAHELPDPDDPDETYTVSYYDYRELIPYLKAGLESRKSRRFFEERRDYRLALDIRLQQRVVEAIRTAVGQDANLRDRIISAVAMDAKSGEVLASVTYPLPEEIEANEDDPERFDHALYANRAPGSTFKIGTAMAAFRALGDEASEWTTDVAPGTRFMRNGGPTGRVTMALAIENSSNVYFGRLAEEAGAEAMLNVMEAAGIRHGFEDQSRQDELDEIMRYTNLQQAGFGQGMVLASPLSMARLTATVANEGMLLPTQWLLLPDTVSVDSLPGEQLITPPQADLLASYMRQVVVGPRGTARRLSAVSVPVAGKTGTAEQDLYRNGQLLGRVTHAWFTGFIPYDASPGTRQIAVTVLVESDEDDLARDRLSGGRDAGPIAGAIFEAAIDLALIGTTTPSAIVAASEAAPATEAATETEPETTAPSELAAPPETTTPPETATPPETTAPPDTTAQR